MSDEAVVRLVLVDSTEGVQRSGTQAATSGLSPQGVGVDPARLYREIGNAVTDINKGLKRYTEPIVEELKESNRLMRESYAVEVESFKHERTSFAQMIGALMRTGISGVGEEITKGLDINSTDRMILDAVRDSAQATRDMKEVLRPTKTPRKQTSWNQIKKLFDPGEWKKFFSGDFLFGGAKQREPKSISESLSDVVAAMDRHIDPLHRIVENTRLTANATSVTFETANAILALMPGYQQSVNAVDNLELQDNDPLAPMTRGDTNKDLLNLEAGAQEILGENTANPNVDLDQAAAPLPALPAWARHTPFHKQGQRDIDAALAMPVGQSFDEMMDQRRAEHDERAAQRSAQAAAADPMAGALNQDQLLGPNQVEDLLDRMRSGDIEPEWVQTGDGQWAKAAPQEPPVAEPYLGTTTLHTSPPEDDEEEIMREMAEAGEALGNLWRGYRAKYKGGNFLNPAQIAELERFNIVPTTRVMPDGSKRYVIDENEFGKYLKLREEAGEGPPRELFARGGMAHGTDTIPAMLSPGEVVVPKKMVDAGAVDHLRGKLPGFAEGGLISGVFGSLANNMTNTDPASRISQFGDGLSSLGAKIGTAVPVVGAFVEGLGLATKGVGTLMAAINQSVDTYGEYSPQIAQAQAQAEIIQTLGDMRRAKEVGPELARFVLAQSEMQQKFEEVKIKLLIGLVPLVTNILEAINMALSSGQDIADAIREIAAPISALRDIIDNIRGDNKDAKISDVKDPTEMLLDPRMMMSERDIDEHRQRGLVPGV